MQSFSVTEVAADLCVSRQRVLAIINKGAIDATRVGNQYTVTEEALDNYKRFEHHAHIRSFSARMAWAAAALADGDSADSITASEAARLRKRLDRLDFDESAWMMRLGDAAERVTRLRVHESHLNAFLADARVRRSGAFATNIVTDSRVADSGTVWVNSETDLSDLTREFGLLKTGSGNLVVKIARVQHRLGLVKGENVFRLIAAVDLLLEGDSRSRSAGKQLLEAVCADRKWAR